MRIGNGKLIPAIGSGEINILAFDKNKWIRKHLSNVLYVPELTNFFSLRAALDKGMTYQSDKQTCQLMKNNSIVAVGERQNKLFRMKFKVITNKSEHKANSLQTALL